MNSPNLRALRLFVSDFTEEHIGKGPNQQINGRVAR